MKEQGLDLIGDLHGEAEMLHALLRRMGYRETGGRFRHPERRVVFLGDYVDRGPAIRETLATVRAMVEHGDAVALLGNHELNMMRYHTCDEAGRWLRPHGSRNKASHAATMTQLNGEMSEWLRWLGTLPLWLDLPKLRAVHAFWDDRCREILGDRNRLDETLLQISAQNDAPEQEAVELLLRGPEIPIPPHLRSDGPGKRILDNMRLIWWTERRTGTYRDLGLHPHFIGPDVPIPEEDLATLFPPTAKDARPLFFGHYWMEGERPRCLSPNVACLDYGVARGGPLVAYRWDGEQILDDEHFVWLAR